MYTSWRETTSDSSMSNINRSVTVRRLPPLTGIGKRETSPQTRQGPGSIHGHPHSRHSPSFSSPSAKSSKQSDRTLGLDMTVTGHPLVNGGGFQRDVTTIEMDHSPIDISPDSVTNYLLDHPEFLESHVTNHVGLEQLETWVRRKARHKQGKTNASHESSLNQHASDTPINQNINGAVSEHSHHKEPRFAKWKIAAHGDKRKLLSDVTRDIHLQSGEPQVLNELACCVATAINADGYHLHIIDSENQDVTHYCHTTSNTRSPISISRPVGPGSTLAAYTAHTKEPHRLGTHHTGEEYPEGIPLDSEHTGPVLAHPVVQTNGNVAAVIEFFREVGNSAFTEDDEEMYHGMMKQRKLNEFLLTVTKSIFQDIVSMDTVIMKIMKHARRLVDADRASLFLLDIPRQELYARIFDVGPNLENVSITGHIPHREIRFPMDKGVAGHVASTGDVLNIPNAYKDERFNRDVDIQTGYKTKTILCMPIYIRGNIIGVVQMVNKLDGIFNKGDEEAFETFAIYCGLALHHAKLYDKIRRSEQKYKVAIEVLSYHSKAPDDEIDVYMRQEIPKQISELTDYNYSPWAVTNDQKPIHVIYMFKDLFSSKGFDLSNLLRFTLTVRKNYRNVPYHNWAHAFSVAHAMFTIIKTTKNEFTALECLALYVAGLCHDLDHRGKTNAFMVKSASPLAAVYGTSTMEHHHFNQTIAILQCLSLYVACLCHDVDHRGFTNQYMVKSSSPLAAIYSTSTMEHHHFNHTITILQQDGHNIFKHLSSDEYKQVLGDIKHCILATDLALFFGNRARLKELSDKKEFSWESKEHREVLMAICMTASDLCSMYKPWELQLQLVHIIMEEFWLQGDEEKAIGVCPIPMMDRDKQDELPASQVLDIYRKSKSISYLQMPCRHSSPGNQQGDEEKAIGDMPHPMMDRDKAHELPMLEVGFLVGICLPCYELLAEVLPESKPMVEGANNNLTKWKQLADENARKEQERQKMLEGEAKEVTEGQVSTT